MINCKDSINEPLLTLHCDGRITASDKAEPTEAAKLVLESMQDYLRNVRKIAIIEAIQVVKDNYSKDYDSLIAELNNLVY